MNASPLPFAESIKKNFIGYTLASFTLLIASIAYAAPAPQQMELRKSELYNEDTFKKSKPAVGSLAPNIELKTLAGKSVALDSYRGKNIVVIKAGYT